MSKKMSEQFIKQHSARFEFAFEDNYMTVQALENYVAVATNDDLKALKSEYTRMRDVAQKRVKRLQNSEFNKSKYIVDRPEGFPKLKDLDPSDIPYAMHDLYKFLHAKTSTVSGQRVAMEKTIKTFKDNGIIITPEEYPPFIKALETMRKFKVMYDSEHVKELVDAMLSTSKADRRTWLRKKRISVLLEHSHELNKLTSKMTEKQGDFLPVDFDDALKEFGWI